MVPNFMKFKMLINPAPGMAESNIHGIFKMS